jgi:hypothetical protein
MANLTDSIGNKEAWTVYFHRACFDGLVSATLAWEFLESKDYRVTEFVPVNYEVRESWLTTPLRAPAAVVDFLYHPDAGFWADHHATSFLSESARQDFLNRQSGTCLLYDEKAGSCAGILWRSLRSQIPNADRFKQAVSWAEKIDTANYDSADEAICGDSAALRIKQTLVVENDLSYYRLLLTEMRSGDLDRVANLTPVAARFAQIQRHIDAGLQRARSHLRLKGTVAIMDIQANGDDIVSRYAPYKFFPQARYSIAIVRSASAIKVTAMRNPWMDFPSIPLGKILEDFGGGGHERVGSIVIPADRAGQLETVVDRLMSEMQSHSATESVPA